MIFGDFGTKNEAKMVKNLQKMEQNSKKSRTFQKKIKRSDFFEKCNTSHLIFMFLGVPRVPKSVKISENGEENAPTAEKTCQKNACEKIYNKNTFLIDFGSILGSPGIPKMLQKSTKTFLFVSSFFAKSTSRRPEPQDPPRSDFWLILAHPSDTFF